MIVTCSNCDTRFKFQPNPDNPAAVKLRCSRCKHVFTIGAPEQIPVAEPSATTPSATSGGMVGPVSKSVDPPDLANIIAVSNQKGGVAKTTTCLNFGTALTLMKKRVLLVDLDIQASLTLSLGYHNTASFYEVIHSGDHNLSEILIKTKFPNLWLLPANKNLVLLNKTHFGSDGFEYLLRNHLLPLKSSFDAIVIDTPPSIEFFTINALTAAGMVIIPSQCEYLSTHGINQVTKMIDLIRLKTNPAIDYRVLLTMYDHSDTANRMIFEKMVQRYNGNRYETVIALDGKVRESQVMSAPVIYYDKESRAGRQYIDLAREYLSLPQSADLSKQSREPGCAAL